MNSRERAIAIRNESQLIKAIGIGPTQIEVINLINQIEHENPAILTQLDRNGFTPLMLACLLERPYVALRLIETGQSNPEHVGRDGDTALIFACASRLNEVALRLIQIGGSDIGHANNDGETALIWACRNGLQDVAIALLETGGANPEQVDNEGKTAFDYARESGLNRVVYHESNKRVQKDMMNYKRAERGSLQRLPEDMNVNIASYLVPKSKNTVELYGKPKGGKSKSKSKRKSKRKSKSKRSRRHKTYRRKI